MDTKLILEMGCNHQGEIGIAKKMIASALSLGAWCVKFQKRDIGSIPEKVKTVKREPHNSFGATYYEHREALEFTVDEIKELKRYSERLDLEFMISVFDLESAIKMVRAGIKYIKLPSQLYTSKLVKFLYNKKLRSDYKILLSTGMHTLSQIFDNGNYNYADILFYCRSIYPCTISEVNINGFTELKNRIKRVDDNIKIGYSSHEKEGEAIPYMVLLGAEYIERHYTLDKSMKGSDHKTVSSNYDDMTKIISEIKEAESKKADYNINGSLLDKEQAVRKKFVEGFNVHKSWYKRVKENKNYKAFVGPEKLYDVFGDLQAKLLIQMGLTENDSLLDVGCGALRAGNYLIPICKEYYGVEPETWLIEHGISDFKKIHSEKLLKEKNPQFFKTIEEVKRKFDYIVLHSIFSHAPINMIKDYLEKLKYMLNPNGKIILTYAQGNKNHVGKTWVYPGLVQYRKEFMFDLFKKYGYKIKSMEWPHTTQKWIVLERWVIIENNVEVKNA